jgi:hypothetical protein
MNGNITAISGFADAVSQSGPVVTRLGGPLGIVGRVAGLGGEELEAGVPGWAWFGVGLMVGAVAMYSLRDRVARFVDT